MMKKLNRLRVQLSILTRHLSIAIFFMLLFSMLLGVLGHNMNAIYDEYKSISAVSAQLSDSSHRFSSLTAALESVFYRDSETLFPSLSDELRALESYYGDISIHARDYETYYIHQDIQNLITSYAVDFSTLRAGIRDGAYDAAAVCYAQMERDSQFIQKETDALIAQLYNDSGRLCDRISHNMLLFNLCLPLITAGILSCLIGAAVYLNSRFVRPIYRLNAMAHQISEGCYPDERLVFETESDFNLLSSTMFDMSTTIRDNIADINNRTRIIQELNLQQIENLRIKSQVNRLELLRLQEQINPHFLFNSLSTLQHTAYLEGAEQTSEICNAIAKLLRYNFRQNETMVRLENEMENLSNYFYIQNRRFGDRIQLQLRLPAVLPHVHMPRMILQPIVENCYNHGLADLCGGGKIQLSVTESPEYVCVRINDNGKGMDAQEIDTYEQLFAQDGIDVPDHTHIGLLNVVKRLQGVYGRKDVIRLYGCKGDFSVELHLFKDEKPEKNDG